MAIVVIEIGAMIVSFKYIERRGNIWWFKRRIPDDVLKQYPDKRAAKISNGIMKFSLGTKDELEAGKKAMLTALQQDSFWANVRNGSVEYGPELFRAAIALLDAYNLKPNQYEEYRKHDLYPDKFMDDLYHDAGVFGPEDMNDGWEKRISPVRKCAADLFFGEKPPLFLSEGINEFFRLTGEPSEAGVGLRRTRVVRDFISVCSDLPIDRYSRQDVNTFITYLLEEKQNKTDTVRKRIGEIRVVFETLCREKEIEDNQIFVKPIIPKLGEDAKVRLPFTPTEVHLIQRECLKKNDDIRWLIALLSDSGMRIAEAVGLRWVDVHLEGPTPYLSLKPDEARRLKNDHSIRNVPLVGAGLWAISQAAKKRTCEFVFPRYIDFDAETPTQNATSASKTVNDWIRNHNIEDKGDKGSHSFRHALNDRLRDVEAPKEIREALCGWKETGMAGHYGKGHSPEVLAKYLLEVVNKDLFPNNNNQSGQ